MKKIALLIVAVFTSAVMYGQFHIGPQIGYTASNLSLNGNDIHTNLQNNMVLGVFMRLGNKVYLQPEVNYLTQGSVFKFPSINSATPVEQNVQLKSIQVPVSLGFQVINLKIVKIRVFGGVTANFVVNKDITWKQGVQTTDAYLQLNNFKNANFQYQAGVGLDVGMFALDVKYYGGLTNLVNGDVTYSDGQVTSVSGGSTAFMVTLGWKIL